MADAIPMPPLELRRLVGPTDPAAFDNPSGKPIYAAHELPSRQYECVFDFGCGVGRDARRLMQQSPRPKKYVGVDPDATMIRWASEYLTSADPAFRFEHHDVYSPSYAPGNSLRRSQPFPMADGEATLVIAHSVFTHVARAQAEYYLGELARVLAPDGIAFTTWLLFDRVNFPFLNEGPFTLFTSDEDFAQAALYDREWVLSAIRRVGLRVKATTPPSLPGHQWEVLLERRTAGAVDHFPLGTEAAGYLCGATHAATPARMVAPTLADPAQERPAPPALYEPLAELAAMRRSRAWKIGRAITAPVRALKRLAG